MPQLERLRDQLRDAVEGGGDLPDPIEVLRAAVEGGGNLPDPVAEALRAAIGGGGGGGSSGNRTRGSRRDQTVKIRYRRQVSRLRVNFL